MQYKSYSIITVNMKHPWIVYNDTLY